MRKETKKSPAIRFRGFTNDWEQRKVSEVAEIITGGTPSTSVEEYWTPKEIPWLSSGEVHKKYIFQTDEMISKEGYENSSAKMINENSVLIALAGQGKTRGTVAINRIPLATNQSIAAMSFNSQMYPDFVFSNLENRYDELRAASSGDGSRGGLNKRIVGNVILPYPSIEEQKQIGDYFTNLNNLITLHQRKLDQLKMLKKYFLQNMFPAKGEKVPRIRFKGFTGDWEQRKFDEIASRESSTGMSSEILPSVEYEDVISEVGQLNKDIAEKAVHKKGIKFDKIHVLYGKLRPYLHNWINPRFKGIAVGDWWVLKPVATDKDFLYRLIQTKQFDDIANLSTGSKMPRADWNLVSKSEFMIPGELKEQHLIGQCFSNLDNLITLHQRKLDQLQTMKKFMLQNMFI